MNKDLRYAHFVELRQQGFTDQKIGEQYGISRERVRQILVGVPRVKKVAVRNRRVVARFNPCDLCGDLVRDRSNVKNIQLHLCAKHNIMRSQLWRLIDDRYFLRHQACVLRSNGRDKPTYTGTWTRRSRRWLIRGSALHQALLLAFSRNLPIIERLPEAVVRQLRDDAVKLGVVVEETKEIVDER